MAIDPIIGSAKVEVHGDFSPMAKDTKVSLGKFDDVLAKRVDESLKPLRAKAQVAGKDMGEGLAEGMDETFDKQGTASADRVGKKIGTRISTAAKKAMQDAQATKAIDDMLVRVRLDKDPFKKDLTDTQRDWFDFGQSLSTTLDKVDLVPSWRRVLGRLGSDRGSVGFDLGKKTGKDLDKGLVAGVKGGNLQAFMTKFIGGLFLKVGTMGVLASFGARAAVALGGGLLGELSVIGTAITGWVSTVVGGAGQALAGIGAVAGGTFATAFAGAYGTVLTSIAAVLPAVQGLKLAFKGLEEEEKKALDARFKEATKNLKGFGRAVRAELLPAIFDSLKALDKVIPTLNKFGTGLGTVAGDLVRDFTKMATSAEMIEEIDTFLSASTGYFKQLGDAAIGLVGKILPAFNAISPVTRKFFTYVTDGAEAAGKALDRLSLGGENSILTTTLDKWFERATKLITVFGTFGRTLGKVLGIAADVGDSKGFIQSLQKMGDSFAEFIDRVSADTGVGGLTATLGDWYDKSKALLGAFGNLSKIILLFFDSAANAGGNFMQDFKKTTDQWLIQFKRWREGPGADVLARWWEQGRDLLGVLGNLGGALLDILGAAARANDDFLKSFERTTAAWERWTDSTSGQNTLKRYFDEARPVVEETWGLLGDILGLFTGSFTGDTGNLVEFIKTIREEWVPAIADIQRIVRESGIQDSLYDLAEALGRMLEVTGGAANGILSTLAVAINALAAALELLGPVVPIVAAFAGSMAALNLLKWAAMASGMGLVAKAFTSVKTAFAGGTAAAGIGGASKGLAGLATKANLAFAALFAISTAVSVFKAPPTSEVDRYTKALNGIGTEAKTVKELFEEPWAAGSNLQKMGLYGTVLEDLQVRLGGLTGFEGGAAKFFTGISDFLGFGVTDAAIAKLDSFTDSIEGLALSGDWRTASEQIAEFEKTVSDANLDPDKWEDSVGRVRKTIADLTTEEFTNQINNFLDVGQIGKARDALRNLAAALAAQGYDPTVITQALQGLNDQIDAMAKTTTVDLTGKFTTEGLKDLKEGIADLKKDEAYFTGGKWTKLGREAKESLLLGFGSVSFGDALQAQLDAIPPLTDYIDPGSGEWTDKGLQYRANIISNADFGEVNGALDALDERTKEAIRVQILADKASYDEVTGELTGEAIKKIIELVIPGIETRKDEIDEVRTKLEELSARPFKVGVNYEIGGVGTGTGKGGKGSSGRLPSAKDFESLPPFKIPTQISPPPPDNYVMLQDAVGTATKDTPLSMYGTINPFVDLTAATAAVRESTRPVTRRMVAYGKLDSAMDLTAARATVAKTTMIVPWRLAATPTGGYPTPTAVPVKPTGTSVRNSSLPGAKVTNNYVTIQNPKAERSSETLPQVLRGLRT